MDVTVPRRIRRRETIWAVRFGQGDRNPEEEAWAAPGRQTESQQPKRSDWHRVARNPDGKTHSPGHLRAPRPSWQRTRNRTLPSPGADGCGARNALRSEPSRGRSRPLPHPRQTGAAERPAETEGQSDAPAEFSGLERNAACRALPWTFRWKSLEIAAAIERNCSKQVPVGMRSADSDSPMAGIPLAPTGSRWFPDLMESIAARAFNSVTS